MFFQKKIDYLLHNHYHSKGGQLGCLFGLVGIILFLSGIAVSFHDKGQGGFSVAALGGGALLCALCGMIACVLGFREEDKFYLYAWIGSLLNGVVLVTIFCMVLIGL